VTRNSDRRRHRASQRFWASFPYRDLSHTPLQCGPFWASLGCCLQSNICVESDCIGPFNSLPSRRIALYSIGFEVLQSRIVRESVVLWLVVDRR
jgi:hypothetical protein